MKNSHVYKESDQFQKNNGLFKSVYKSCEYNIQKKCISSFESQLKRMILGVDKS